MPRPRLRSELAHGVKSAAWNVTSIDDTDSPYTMSWDEDLILCDTGDGAITVNLPTPADAVEQAYTVKRISAGGNDVTVDTPGAETIDGAADVTLGAQWATVTVVSDGTNWHKVSEF